MARPKQTLTQWFAGLPETTGAIRVRVGSGKTLPTVAVIALEEAKTARLTDHEALIVDSPEELGPRAEAEALASGWPEEAPAARFHAYGVNGKELCSKVVRADPQAAGAVSSDASIVRTLTDALVQMAGEGRRSLEIVTNTLSHREDMLADALQATMAYRQDAQDAEVQAYVAKLVADEQLELEGDDDRLGSTATQILEGVANTLMGQRAKTIDAADLEAMLDADPDLLDRVASDEGLVARIVGAFQAKAAADLGDDSEAEPEAEPPAG